MYDHHAHVMGQQHERRISAAAERRRSNLEAVERSRTEKSDHRPDGHVEGAAPATQPSTLVVA